MTWAIKTQSPASTTHGCGTTPSAQIETGLLPVVAVLKGAVVVGGWSWRAAAHLRVAEDSTFFALPEGSRGLFVGGGASGARAALGTHRMTDMMLTGRVLTADEGAGLGLAQYRVPDGAGLDKALALAARIAKNSALTNYAVLQALPLIAQAAPETGLLMESLMSAIAQSSTDAKEPRNAFLDGRADRVRVAAEEQ